SAGAGSCPDAHGGAGGENRRLRRRSCWNSSGARSRPQMWPVWPRVAVLQCLALAAAMAQGTALMMNDGAVNSGLPAADPTASAAIEVAHLVKVYKTTRAVEDV